MRWALLAGTSLAAYAAAATSAFADPISIAIVGAVAGSAFLATTAGAATVAITTFALTTAISGALTYGASLLTAKSSASASGVQSEVTFGGDVPRTIPFGTCRVAGQFIYFAGVGEKNKVLHLVYALADWECDGLDHVYVDDVKKALIPVGAVGTEHAHYQVSGFGPNLSIRFFRGTMTQTADSYLVSQSGVRATGLGDWTSSHRGAGVCYVAIRLEFNEDLFQGGIPSLEYQLRGAKLYDRRLDTTAGGSGSQLWSDPTTWAFSKNPVVMEENYRRGFYRNGVRLLGMGMASSDLLGPHYVSAANVCDEDVTEGAGTNDRYACSAIINDDAEYRSATDTFMGACAGVVVEKSGLFGPLAGASQPIVKTFTDSDLIVGFDTTCSVKLPRAELFNAVMGSYTKASENWQADSFVPVTNSTWEADDNGERLVKDLSLLQVTNSLQASRIAKIVANLGRKQVRHVGSYGPAFLAVEAGDWVTLTNRFGTFTMQVEAKRELSPLVFQFSMRETGVDVYGGAATGVTDPVIVQDDVSDHVTVITGFAVTAVSIAGAGNQIRPGIKVDWTPPGDPSVVAVKIEYRIQSSSNVTPIIVASPLDGTFTIQSDLMAGTTYEVRGRYQLNPDLTSNWSSWLAVTTTSTYTVVTSQIAIDTQDFFDQFVAEVEGQGMTVLLETLTRYQQDQDIRFSYNTSQQQVLAAQNNQHAEVTFRMDALASDQEALAQALITVQAAFASDTGETTMANGAFKMEAVAAGSGASASIAAYVSADNGVNYVFAGYRLDVTTGGVGRFVVQADQFAIVQNAAGVPFTPFAVIGPDTYINRVIVNNEIISGNYAADPAGNPATGFRASSDGLLRAYDGRFTDLQARGGTFKERPLLLDVPNFRNGIPEGLPSVRWTSPGSITALGGAQLVSLFSRSPDCLTLSATQAGTGGDYVVLQTFMVPPGHRLPPRMVADLPGQLFLKVWNDDGTIDSLTLNANGAITATATAAGWWMFDVERDPLILNPKSTNKYICGLGYTRYAQPLRIPEFLFNGSTLVTSVSFKCWGAGGGHDENAGGQGGPGGYVAGTFSVSDKSGSGFLKRGDMIYLIVGEGGKSKSSDVVFGFGGPGQSLDSRSGGGGLSGIFKYSVTRANAMLIAGGGGAQSGSGTANGGPGGAAASGGNGVSGTDAEIMTGLGWAFNGSNQQAGGGGGYVGGGYLGLVSSRQAGKGGTNFVHASATTTTNSASAVDGNGNASTATPPNSADSDFTAWDDCLGNTALAARGKTSTVQAQQGGNGLIVVTFA